jgi:HSP20 family molecular chaperone IbpA
LIFSLKHFEEIEMNDSQEIKTQDKQDVRESKKPEAYMRPAVDIYEDKQGITLLADLPGVSRDRLNIEIDNNTLTIEGEVMVDFPDSMEAIYADVRAKHYQRSFTLSSELQTDNISAELKDGILTIAIPKREELQPRKIVVSPG